MSAHGSKLAVARATMARELNIVSVTGGDGQIFLDLTNGYVITLDRTEAAWLMGELRREFKRQHGGEP